MLKSGEKYVLKVYGTPELETYISNYLSFIRKASKTKFNLARLPPTQEALKYIYYERKLRYVTSGADMART